MTRGSTTSDGVQATREYNESGQMFLAWLDGELQKVDTFYQEKEQDIAERYKLLSNQLHRLSNLRDEVKYRPSTVGSTTVQFNHLAIYRSIRDLIPSLPSASPGQWSDHQRRRNSDKEKEMDSLDCEITRRRLKQATMEAYREMETLMSYRLLNRTAVTKLLKKSDKATGKNISEDYTQRIKAMHFDQSDDLSSIMEHTEVRPH